MTEYSFSIEKIIPESDCEVPAEMVDAMRRKIDQLIRETICPPAPPPVPKLSCGCLGVLHRPGCPMWCYT